MMHSTNLTRFFATLVLCLSFQAVGADSLQNSLLPQIEIQSYPVRKVSGISEEWLSYTLSAQNGTRFAFRIHMPQKTEAGRPYSLFVFLGGSGSEGTDNLEQMRNKTLNTFLESKALGNSIIILPQIPFAQSWDTLEWSAKKGSPHASENPTKNLQALMALVLQISQKYAITPKRRILAGHSLGACGALETAIHYPDAFLYYLAISGASDAKLLAEKALTNSIFLFHGEEDANVPFTMSLNIYNALTIAHKEAELIRFPKAGHDLIKQVLAHPRLLELLQSL